MKLPLLFFLLFIQMHLFSQVENEIGINFQAIARNTDGSIIPEKGITIRLSIIEGSPDGKIVYQEIKSTRTNVVGSFNIVIGLKEQSYIGVIGDFNLINWQISPKFLRVEIDPNGGIQFLNLGVQKMNYVPYALVSNSVHWKNVTGLDSIVSKKINITDTALMLAGYQRKDTTSQLYLSPFGSAANLTNFPILNQNTTGKAATANKADSANVAQNITATSNSTLTTLPNLSSVGTITTGVWSGTAIANNQLENNSITIGANAISLGSSSNSLSGLTSVTSSQFVGDLIGNAFSASSAITASRASSATLAGNITATANSTLTTLPNLSSIGTITTGVWSGTAIDIAHGGTGVSQLHGILLGTNGSGVNTVSTAAYGSWYDNTTQLATIANTAYPVVYNTEDFAQGISIIDNSKILFAKAGKYNIQFSLQFDRSAGTSTEYVSIWLRKNGVDIPATCTDITIQGGTAVAATVAAWNFFQSVNDNDYLELIWSTTSTNIQIQYLPARTNPTRPLIPSVILTAQQVY